MTRIRVIALTALLAACSSHVARHTQASPPTTTEPGSTSAPSTSTSSAPKVKIAGGVLVPFHSCDELLSTVRAEAAAEVGPYGFGGGTMPGVAVPMMAPRADTHSEAASAPASPGGEAAASSSAGSSSAGSSSAASSSADNAPTSPAFSTTNNQEVGVDEPDLAKTDGHVMVVLRNSNVVQVLTVGSSGQTLRGSLMLPGQVRGLFMVGSDVVAFGSPAAYPVPYGQPGGATPMMYPAPGGSTTTVWVIGVANAGTPTLLRSYSVSGSYDDARLIGHSIKLVVESQPRINFPAPQSDPNAATAANRAAIAHAPVSAWVPAVTSGNGVTKTADCGTVDHAPGRYGVGMVSVVTLDPAKDQPVGMVSILGNPGTVYASTTALYVATNSYDIQQGAYSALERTMIHEFSINGDGRATYVASGTVPGILLNQFAMSEYGGNLRVATTTGTPSPPPFEGSPVPPADGSQSMVTVLHAATKALVPIGQVGGLGVTQKIYGVRFVGPLGYVVTFRQMDPLYVVDLSAPTHPVVRGSLELTGYSAYLNAVEDGYVLGVGQAADANGRQQGLQVSLFDVRNADHPGLVDKKVIAGANADVTNDSHAFLWWPSSKTVVLPGQQYQYQYPPCPPGAMCPVEGGGGGTRPYGGSFVGAFVWHVDPATGVTESGQITHMGRDGTGYGAIRRAIVVGDRLYTISDAGVLASDLHSLGDIAWTSFPQSPPNGQG